MYVLYMCVNLHLKIVESEKVFEPYLLKVTVLSTLNNFPILNSVVKIEKQNIIYSDLKN